MITSLYGAYMASERESGGNSVGTVDIDYAGSSQEGVFQTGDLNDRWDILETRHRYLLSGS